MKPETSSATPETRTRWYLTRPAVIWGLLLLGPFALPLLVFSPKFKKTTKIIISVITVALSVLSYIYTPQLIDLLMSRYESLQAAGSGGV